jgi:hypothetical protein
MTKILDAAGTNKLILSIKTRAGKLQNDVHQAAVSSLAHAVNHGDVTLLNRLLMALPASARRNALAAWAIKFGPFIANTDKTTKSEAPLMHMKRDDSDIQGAIAQPYWELKASEDGDKELDIVKSFDSLLKRVKALHDAAPDGEQKAKLAAMLAV